MTDTEFDDFYYSARDGLKLHARVYGAANRKTAPVVCLPGLTRNVRDFHELALHLARRKVNPRKVISFDYRGRGLSEYDRKWKNYTVLVEAEDILDGLVALGVPDAHFIGTSRGGLIVHMLAVMRPAVISSAVFNDIGPAIEGEGLVQIRAYLERAPKPKTLADAMAIQKATHAGAFPALSDPDWERLVGALYRMEKGKLRLDFDRNLVKTLRSIDLGRPLPTLWPQFDILADRPVMVIRGENSRLLSTATVEEMSRRHPAVEAVTAPGQGHAPMLETGELPDRIATFLDRADGRATGAT